MPSSKFDTWKLLIYLSLMASWKRFYKSEQGKLPSDFNDQVISVSLEPDLNYIL